MYKAHLSVICMMCIYIFNCDQLLLKKNENADLNCKGQIRLIKAVPQRCSVKEAVINNFQKFTGGHLCRSLFLIKKRLQHRWFFCEFCEFFTNMFFYRAPSVAASGLNFFLYLNWNPNFGRPLFNTYINPFDLERSKT